MVVRETCPTCGANRYKKNGHTRHESRTISVKRVAASLQRMPETGAWRPSSASGSPTCSASGSPSVGSAGRWA